MRKFRLKCVMLNKSINKISQAKSSSFANVPTKYNLKYIMCNVGCRLHELFALPHMQKGYEMWTNLLDMFCRIENSIASSMSHIFHQNLHTFPFPGTATEKIVANIQAGNVSWNAKLLKNRQKTKSLQAK